MQYDDREVGLILRAVAFAAERHSGQRRKDAEETPYVNHPIAVAEVLWRVGGARDVAVLVAALLHDTVEDTGTPPEEIEDLFGAEVVALVLEVSDDKSLPKAVRKELQIEHAARASAKAKLIKLADKICNVIDLARSPPIRWSLERRAEYLDWAESVVAGMRGTDAALEARFDEAVREARAGLGGG